MTTSFGRLAKKVMLIFTLWTGAPVVAFAGWGVFDWIGTATTAVSDAVWKTVLINAVKDSLPLVLSYFLLYMCIGGAIGTLVLAKGMMDDLKDTLRAEIAAEKKSNFDRVMVAFYALVTTPTVLVMLGFGIFLAYASYSGIDGIMHLKPPPGH